MTNQSENKARKKSTFTTFEKKSIKRNNIVQGILDKTPIKVLFDTRSTINILKTETCKKLKLNQELLKEPLIVEYLSGTTKIEKKSFFIIEFKNKPQEKYKVSAYLDDQIPYDLILGTTFHKENKVVIDFGKMKNITRKLNNKYFGQNRRYNTCSRKKTDSIQHWIVS